MRDGTSGAAGEGPYGENLSGIGVGGFLICTSEQRNPEAPDILGYFADENGGVYTDAISFQTLHQGLLFIESEEGFLIQSPGFPTNMIVIKGQDSWTRRSQVFNAMGIPLSPLGMGYLNICIHARIRQNEEHAKHLQILEVSLDWLNDVNFDWLGSLIIWGHYLLGNFKTEKPFIKSGIVQQGTLTHLKL
ncbi:hypothetical protein ACJX0J_007626, partial [Zea mays]